MEVGFDPVVVEAVGRAKHQRSHRAAIAIGVHCHGGRTGEIPVALHQLEAYSVRPSIIRSPTSDRADSHDPAQRAAYKRPVSCLVQPASRKNESLWLVLIDVRPREALELF